MGLFDNLKKKNEAKRLGLSVEQYDEYMEATKQGISLEQYKRYLASFSGKLSLLQFVDYLYLEKVGMADNQIMRYLTELSSKIKVEDYSDFLEAEKIGLSQSEYVAYSNTLKGKMTAVDYVGFLKAQKIGFTLGKYLQYLKSFKDEMSLEEYDTYLQAEANGMDREHYAEFLREYKDKFTVERYLEFDKARSLGMTLEEYDLRIEASKLGMSVEQYKSHIEAEKLGMSDEEYKVYLELLNGNAVSNETLTIPESMSELPKNVFKQFDFKRIVFNNTLTKIPDGAFAGCKSLAELDIPESIKELGEEAFKGCSALQNLTLHKGIEEIGDSAFEDCASLSKVFVPGTVKNVGYHSFLGCSKLESIEFEFGVESIDVSEWADLPCLERVISPATASIRHLPPFRKNDPKYGTINPERSLHMSSETKIDYVIPCKYSEYGIEEHRSEIEYLEVHGDYVFLDLEDFPNLKTVEFSCKGAVKSVRNCPSLQMILYSDYMAEIPSGTVTTEKQREEKIIEMKTLTMTGINAPALRFVGVGDGAMVIDLDNAEGFKLAWLHIPACCSRVGINTPVISAIAIHGNCKVSSDYLNNTNALSVIRFDKDARENGIYSNSKAKTVLPAELSDCGLIDLEYETEAITAEHFGVQSSVKAIILPQSVKSISDNAFEGWGLENIVIPASVEKIGSNIFMDCIQLKSVVFESIPKMFGCDTFDGCSSLESIVIGGQTLSGDEFAEQYETQVSATVIESEVTTAYEDILEETDVQDDTPFDVISEQSEVEIEDDDRVVVNVGGQFSMRLPANFIYSTDAAVIGDNRVLIAMLDDGTADFDSPYSATQSITVLIGKEVTSSEDADAVADSIGLENGNVMQDIPGLNVRYAVKEAGEALSIYLALICTDSNSYPTQIFFNNAIGVDADQMVAGLLKSVEIKGESVTETREEQEESSERVDLAEEKVAAIITVLKSRYPKGSILPKSFEELKFKNFDLQLSTLNKWTMIAYGQKARDYLIREGLLPAKMTAADVKSQIADAKPIEERTISTDVPAGVLYQPGSEPEKIKVRLDRLFEKLDSAYPDKVIVGLNKNHKKWGETVTELYRLLGYPDNNSFLNAYGYITGTGASGRPANDPMLIIEELKRRYPNGSGFDKMADLRAANPDIAPKFSNLQNQADKFFGMPFAKYLIQEGILVGKTDDQCGDEFEALKSRYSEKPFTGTLLELKSANDDIDWNAVNRYYSQNGSSDTFKVFLMKQGILVEQETSFEGKLAEITEELKKRYPETKKFSGTLSKLKSDNSDLSLSSINTWTMRVYNLSAQDYLTQQGIMEAPKSVEDKLAAVTETLKERYASGEKKAYTITDLREQNLDLPISTIGTWSKKVFNQNATEYLTEQGILSEYDWMAEMRLQNERREAEAKAREERLEAEMKAPIETVYYEPQVYSVPEIDVSGVEANEWKYKDDYYYHEGEIYIEDYLGNNDHIVIPTSINGKRVTNLDTFGLKTCKASIVEIPGSIKNLAGHLGYQNENIQTVIVGEGVETIGESCFSFVKNLKTVKVSRSVISVGDTAFKYTPWYEAQDDLIIIGSVLTEMKQDHAVLNVPQGIKTVGRLVAVFKSALRKVVLPESVTTLCESAFSGRGNENIKEFIFTDSLTNIGLHSFGFNKWTENFGDNPVIINNQLYQFKVSGSQVVIPDGVTKICDEVFKANKDIMSVVFPKTLKSIGEQAFGECQNLTSISLPEGVERLEKACFYGCKKLSSVSLPDSLTVIGRSAFNSCPALTEITLGDSVEVIGEKAFVDCRMLRSFTMNEKVRTIGDEAFKNCAALQKIELPDSVAEIGSNAFSGCASLDEIIVPGKVKKVGSSAFNGCKALKMVSLGSAIEEIADSAFAGCNLIEEIILPKTVGPQAFNGCSGLKKISFNPEMTVIDKNTFNGCTGLIDIVIPDAVTEIREGAFSGCTNLRSVTLPAGLALIGKSAFSGCTALESISIPDTVKTVEDNAFKDCTSLSEVAMSDSIENFGLDVFTNSPYMKKEFGDFVIMGGILSKYLGTDKEVTIPDNVSTIGENAFAEAYHVETIIIPNTVKTIANKLFGTFYTWGNEAKPQLKKVVIGDGVTTIGNEAFANCEKLTEVVFGTGLSSIGQNAFSGCKELKAIDLSMTALTEIKQEAFNGCYNAKKLVLPSNIEIIERNAFSGIGLGVLQLPKSVKKVERSAFDGASELIVYDTIDPDAVEANEWKYDRWNGSVNSPLACAMLDVPQSYVECQGNTRWRGYHITVLSANSGDVRYRIFCDSEERDDYRAMMFSAWGKNASFTFDAYDDYFMKTRNMLGRAEMAFCRIQYPEGLSTGHRANYEAYLERCMYIERSAKRTAEIIGNEDAVERLAILDRYKAIDDHNIGWIKEIMKSKKAKKCQAYLDEHYSM